VIREFFVVLSDATIQRMPFTGDWMATCAVRGAFHDHLHQAVGWTLARAWEAARENVSTRRSIGAQR
jgi:hypothetical protein